MRPIVHRMLLRVDGPLDTFDQIDHVLVAAGVRSDIGKTVALNRTNELTLAIDRPVRVSSSQACARPTLSRYADQLIDCSELPSRGGPGLARTMYRIRMFPSSSDRD